MNIVLLHRHRPSPGCRSAGGTAGRGRQRLAARRTGGGDYAVVWAPPQQFLDEQRAWALFNIGAG